MLERVLELWEGVEEGSEWMSGRMLLDFVCAVGWECSRWGMDRLASRAWCLDWRLAGEWGGG